MEFRSSKLATSSTSMKRRAVFAGVISVALLSASLVTSFGPTANAAGTLKIGVSLSLTGDFADSGTAAQKGYLLWQSEVNKKGGILGRKVSIKIVNDASSPDQVVTNYTNLITQSKVDIVMGPFSSLLTIPASRVAKRYGYSFIEPAGGGPKVFLEKNPNLFFVQPAATTKGGDIFADYILSLPAAQRPKTAAYVKLDDPFAAPLADNIKARFEAAGIKTVYDQTYPSETADMTPVISGVATANPDVVVGGTQNADAFAQVKAMIQLNLNPKFLFLSNGANAPVEFPKQIGIKNTEGIFTSADWYPQSTVPGSAAFIKAYIAMYKGTAEDIDPTSAEAFSAGTLLELVAKKTGKIDNKTIIATLHKGSWPTLVGNLSWNAYGEPQGAYLLTEWIGGHLKTVYPAATAQHAPVIPKPAWVG